MPIECEQYTCMNNTGLEKGKITYGIGGKCKLEKPRREFFEIEGRQWWSCEDERYGNEVEAPK